MKCPKCGGTGKILQEFARNYQKSVACDYCEGTGEIDATPNDDNEIVKRLDVIIGLLGQLLEKK